MVNTAQKVLCRSAQTQLFFHSTMKWGLITVSIENVLVEGFHVSLMALDRQNSLYKNKNVIDSVRSIWNAISVC